MAQKFKALGCVCEADNGGKPVCGPFWPRHDGTRGNPDLNPPWGRKSFWRHLEMSRTGSPAPPCSRPASRRRGFQPAANMPAGTTPAGVLPRRGRPQTHCCRTAVGRRDRERAARRRANARPRRVDAMPARQLPGFQQEIDRRRCGAAVAGHRRETSRGSGRPRDAVSIEERMTRLRAEVSPSGSRSCSCARGSPRRFPVRLPLQPNRALMAGSPGRRNGLVSSSWSSRVGSVGLSSSRSDFALRDA